MLSCERQKLELFKENNIKVSIVIKKKSICFYINLTTIVFAYIIFNIVIVLMVKIPFS